MTSTIIQCTVYTKPGCPQCDKTKAYFDAKGVPNAAVGIAGVPAP
jgi:glutaredoxin-like protein NrdH